MTDDKSRIKVSSDCLLFKISCAVILYSIGRVEYLGTPLTPCGLTMKWNANIFSDGGAVFCPVRVLRLVRSVEQEPWGHQLERRDSRDR